MKIPKFMVLSLLALVLSGQSVLAQKQPAIIPLPVDVAWQQGTYALPAENTICYTADAEESAKWLQQLLDATGSKTKLEKGKDCGNFSMNLNKNLSKDLGEEGYTLEVSQKGVTMSAATQTGLFYAVQTLRQMLPALIEKEALSGKVSLAQVKISDKPTYSWRGSMLDIARSFFGPTYIKQHIDRMALYKLNRLHLHLTDDQGWRIEIKDKPKLTEVGGNSSMTGGRSGFLTQEEYKDIQAYANARHIVIIPEIDMPGHIYAALISYPELNCDGFTNLKPQRATPPEAYHEPNVGWSNFCMDKPEIYDFVSTVVGELADMTTGPWIHIGGDEIEDPHYKGFVIKADSIVRKFGKTSIGWEEVTQAKIDTSFITQRWNGKTKSVVDGLKTIESICSNFYIDHGNVPGQENTNNWCKKDGVSLKDTYTFTTTDNNVIGIEAPLWTEKVHTHEDADDRFWPRTIAVAEVGWSKQSHMDFDDFTKRLAQQGERLDNLGVNYFKSPEVAWNTTVKDGVFKGYNPDGKSEKTASDSKK